MVDVVPELLSEIETSFQKHTMSDRRLAQVSKRIRDGTATQADGHTYAECLGKNASKALRDVLTEENLPDGKLYYNIATRTVIPTLENNQKMINDAAADIQKVIDGKNKIYLNTLKPDFPKERVNGLIDKMTADDITLEQALVWIKEPIVNNSEAFFDDFIRTNAEFRSESGLKTKVSRIPEAKCCQWCENLAGTYDYGTEPDEFYARHESCRCTVTYINERKRESQNVWSKKTWQSTPEELARRANTQRQTTSVEERQEELKQLDSARKRAKRR
jgi:hypothetical protein